MLNKRFLGLIFLIYSMVFVLLCIAVFFISAQLLKLDVLGVLSPASLDGFKRILLNVGGWWSVFFSVFVVLMNVRLSAKILSSIIAGRSSISILVAPIFFVCIFFAVWLWPDIFLQGFGMRSYLSSGFWIFCMSAQLPGAFFLFLCEVKYVKH